MNGILIAAKIEAEPFIKGLRLELEAERPFALYRGENCRLIISGIGKVNAALAAAALIREYGVERIYNLGSAGALAEHLSLGEIRHISAVYEHDRPPLNKKKLPKMPSAVIDGHLTASLATGDTPVTAPEERSALAAIADLADMEGAAVVRACRRYGKASFLFKGVSDCADTPASEIIGNIHSVSALLFDYFAERVMNSAGFAK